MSAPFEDMPGPAERIAIFSGSPEARLLEAMHAHGPTFRFFEASTNKWMIASGDPAVAEHVLVKNAKGYTKGLFIGVVELLLGDGIMVSEGAEWLQQRRLVQQAFHRAALARVLPVIRRQNVLAAERVSANDALDVTQWTSEIALDITLAFLLGDDLLATDGRVVAGPFSLLARISARDMSFRKAFAALGEPLTEMIERRRAEGGNDALAEIVGAAKAAGLDDVPRLVAEAKTLLVAGHETTASAMAFFWWLVAQRPDTQRALGELSLVDVVDPSELLERAGIARAAVDEALRLYPPGWVLPRKTIAADEIAGYAVPAGVDVLVSPWLVGRNPALFSEPDRFVPERFMAPVPRMHHLPFSAGPRQCVGDRLAMLELVVHAAEMARRFRFAGSSPLELEARVNLRPAANIVLQVTPAS